MVGVAGKYKGCNTCRARRVKVRAYSDFLVCMDSLIGLKCDNERPTCRKCSDSGRECQGYGESFFPIHISQSGTFMFGSRPYASATLTDAIAIHDVDLE